MRTVVVTDGEQRSTLAVVRSLGRIGYRVIVTSRSPRSLAGSSRYAAAVHEVPSALAEPAAFAREIRRITSGASADLLVPMTEPAVLAITGDATAFAPAIIPFPRLHCFLRISDKVEVSDAAGRFGIRVPDQIVLHGPEELLTLPSWAAAGAVLKPGRSVNAGQKLSVSYIRQGEDPEAVIRSLPQSAFPLLVQQRITGPGAGVFLLRWNGRTIAAFGHRRIREKPPSGGVSVVRESVPVDDDLYRRSEKLLDHFDWNGVAMLEFKRDAVDGTPYLMEINGRFWGSLQLAVDAGVDFPALLAAAALGEDPSPVMTYRTGVRSRWLMGDVDHLLARLRRSRQALNLDSSAPGRARVVASFLRDFLPPSKLEVLRLSDPRPFLVELGLWLRNQS
jgi:predicted ATP-grasp superfamily ATP-dependent carboligase